MLFTHSTGQHSNTARWQTFLTSAYAQKHDNWWASSSSSLAGITTDALLILIRVRLRVGEDCSWSLVPPLVLVNDKMMPPNGNVRNIPTCPAQCPATPCWIGHKWKQPVCQMKLTTFHRTFCGPHRWTPRPYTQPSSYAKICSVLWLHRKNNLQEWRLSGTGLHFRHCSFIYP